MVPFMWEMDGMDGYWAILHYSLSKESENGSLAS